MNGISAVSQIYTIERLDYYFLHISEIPPQAVNKQQFCLGE